MISSIHRVGWAVMIGVLAGYLPLFANELSVTIGDFSRGDISGWEEKVLQGSTSYSLVATENKTVLQAKSNGSASGFVKSVRIDLDRTPYLNWSWKIDNTLQVADEKIKSGDDYPARVYVIFKTGNWAWNINALNYVWSSVNSVGSDWPNAFSSKAWMIAVASGNKKAGHWVTVKRNVKKDYAQYFNKTVRYIDAIAIMTDTDNSKANAVAYYGDIYFSSH